MGCELHVAWLLDSRGCLALNGIWVRVLDWNLFSQQEDQYAPWSVDQRPDKWEIPSFIILIISYISYKRKPHKNRKKQEATNGTRDRVPEWRLPWWFSSERICLPMQDTWVWSLGWEDPLEKAMATHSSILAWEIHGQKSLVSHSPWGRKRIGHDLEIKQHKTKSLYPL